ncbi:gag-protease polyprotein [Cucumis melo var. makuwa]|uniref:Gag-protease polyprotein n=1 Tax=Cucumis melo var. makuwa TaxID=1194695 RepID=A0A5A7TWW2_CUCMM|nr:gag-protease polyprotein [Cucumis melo var. makuwa]
MFTDALAQFHAVQQTPPALTQASMEPYNVPNQLLAESKHLRDFRKYNPKMFEGSLKDPAKTQMWLASLETIFRYMKCSNNKKWHRQEIAAARKTLEKDDMTVETNKFVSGLRLDIQGFVRAFRPTTHADALYFAVDMSLHERADPSKAVGKGSISGRKRKAEL